MPQIALMEFNRLVAIYSKKSSLGVDMDCAVVGFVSMNSVDLPSWLGEEIVFKDVRSWVPRHQ
jgi:hypothetical protein